MSAHPESNPWAGSRPNRQQPIFDTAAAIIDTFGEWLPDSDAAMQLREYTWDDPIEQASLRLHRARTISVRGTYDAYRLNVIHADDPGSDARYMFQVNHIGDGNISSFTSEGMFLPNMPSQEEQFAQVKRHLRSVVHHDKTSQTMFKELLADYAGIDMPAHETYEIGMTKLKWETMRDFWDIVVADAIHNTYPAKAEVRKIVGTRNPVTKAVHTGRLNKLLAQNMLRGYDPSLEDRQFGVTKTRVKAYLARLSAYGQPS